MALLVDQGDFWEHLCSIPSLDTAPIPFCFPFFSISFSDFMAISISRPLGTSRGILREEKEQLEGERSCRMFLKSRHRR